MADNNSSTHQRSCIVTGKKADKSDLIRFVRDPEGSIVADLAQKLPGRGAWLVPDPDIVSKAVHSGRLRHHLNTNELDAAKIVQRTADQLSRQVLASLSLLRKAGLVLFGRQNIERHGGIEGVLIADDASEKESRSLLSQLQPSWIESGLPASILGQAAGRDSLAYAAVPTQKNKTSSHPAHTLVSRLRRDINQWRGFQNRL